METDPERVIEDCTKYLEGEFRMEDGPGDCGGNWKTVPVVHNLEELIDELRTVFQSERVNVEYVKALMSAYRSNRKDWKKYAKFDTRRYTRNLVDTGNDRYNLMILCWAEGQCTNIHDHSDAHCFVKVLDGQIKETMYAWPSTTSGDDDGGAAAVGTAGEACGSCSEGGDPDRADGAVVEEDGTVEPRPMQTTAINYYAKDAVSYISDSIGLHRLENNSHIEPAVTLHLYSPPFSSCRTFDQRNSAVTRVKMTFWSQFGVRTPFQPKKVKDFITPEGSRPVTGSDVTSRTSIAVGGQ